MAKEQKIKRNLIAGAKKEGVSIREYANKVIAKIEDFANRHPAFKKVCMAIVSLIMVIVFTISLVSCGDKEEAILFDEGTYTGIVECVDDIAEGYSSSVLQVISVDSFDVNADDTCQDSFVKINAKGYEGSKKDEKKITFTLNGTEENYESIKILDDKCTTYYQCLSDENKTENERNQALNDYLTTAYLLVSGYKSDFTIQTESITSKSELKFDKADSVVSKVIEQVAVMNEEGQVDAQRLSQLAKLVSYGDYIHTGSVISTTRDRSAGITTIRYKVTSTCGDNSFSVEYVIKSQSNLTPEDVKGIVENVINGKALVQDVDVEMDIDSLTWTNACHLMAWRNINSALSAKDLSAEK